MPRNLLYEPLQRTKKGAQDEDEEGARESKVTLFKSMLHLNVIYSKTRDVSTDVSLACS
jgi:hypothetical protein